MFQLMLVREPRLPMRWSRPSWLVTHHDGAMMGSINGRERRVGGRRRMGFINGRRGDWEGEIVSQEAGKWIFKCKFPLSFLIVDVI